MLVFGNKALPRGRFADLLLPIQQLDLSIKKKTTKERYDITVFTGIRSSDLYKFGRRERSGLLKACF